MLRVTALVAAVLGGLCWIVEWAASVVVGDGGLTLALHGVGLALLAVAVAVVGAGLVSSSAAWLRVLVAVAAPMLAWSVHTVVRGEGDGFVLDGVLGVVALATVAVVLMVGGRTGGEASPGRRPGAHSAR